MLGCEIPRRKSFIRIRRPLCLRFAKPVKGVRPPARPSGGFKWILNDNNTPRGRRGALYNSRLATRRLFTIIIIHTHLNMLV